MSLGVSSSQSQSTTTKQSTGPVAFGSVNIVQPSAASSSLLPIRAAIGAVVAFFVFKRKV